jgi:outer membrane murein-binding lipoprotein Lpp
MNKIVKGISLGAIILGTVAISGCSNHEKLDKISTDISVINQKVDGLNAELQDLHEQTAQASAEAARANARLDNAEQIKVYKK